jgi:tetrapyrrole methylase family protein/MazG family protein
MDKQILFDPATFKNVYDTIVRLRSPGGCPWDQEQTPQTLRGDLIEETFECVEAIDEQNPAHIKEELGDIFLLATMISYMHEQAGAFSLNEVLLGLTDKLIRRHPHVFGTVPVKDSAEVLENWARYKVTVEGREKKDSVLDTVHRGIPPLDRAYKLQKKASNAGFDWESVEGIFDKITEELGEVKAELNAECPQKLEAELGDLLFIVVNLCRFLHIEPSVALQRTNIKFVNRFKYIEKMMKETEQEMKIENIAVMEEYWEQAKKALKADDC